MRLLFLPRVFRELTIDGLIDTGTSPSAIPEADFQKIRLLVLQSIVKEAQAPTVRIMAANGQLHQISKSTLELNLRLGTLSFMKSSL